MIRTNLRKLGKVARSNQLAWRYMFNFGPSVKYQLHRQPLSGEAKRVLDTLNRDGVAVTSVDALLKTDDCYRELESAVARLTTEQGEALEAGRSMAQLLTERQGTEKVYLRQLLGDRPRLDTHEVFARFALQEPVVQIANAYYEMYTRLRSFNVWHNFAREAPAVASQLWHRDKDDLHFTVKVFTLLTDVDETNGPFVYAKRSHAKGRYRGTPAFLYKDGNTERSDDAQMAELVPADEWLQCVGPKGTMIFADTRGYHKGGRALERDRIMFVSMFSSPHGQRAPDGVEFERGERIPFPVSKEQELALAPPGT